jgi:hypothetical protein
MAAGVFVLVAASAFRRHVLKRVFVVLFAVVALACVLLGLGLFSKPFSEGVESIGNGYYVVDTGDKLWLGYTNTDGSLNQQFGSSVKAFQLRRDMLFVARWPDKRVEQSGRLEDVREGGGCQYWRIDTRTHEATQVSKDEARVDC